MGATLVQWQHFSQWVSLQPVQSVGDRVFAVSLQWVTVSLQPNLGGCLCLCSVFGLWVLCYAMQCTVQSKSQGTVQTKQCTQEKNGQWVVGSGSTGHAVFAVLGVL